MCLKFSKTTLCGTEGVDHKRYITLYTVLHGLHGVYTGCMTRKRRLHDMKKKRSERVSTMPFRVSSIMFRTKNTLIKDRA